MELDPQAALDQACPQCKGIVLGLTDECSRLLDKAEQWQITATRAQRNLLEAIQCLRHNPVQTPQMRAFYRELEHQELGDR